MLLLITAKIMVCWESAFFPPQHLVFVFLQHLIHASIWLTYIYSPTINFSHVGNTYQSHGSVGKRGDVYDDFSIFFGTESCLTSSRWFETWLDFFDVKFQPEKKLVLWWFFFQVFSGKSKWFAGILLSFVSLVQPLIFEIYISRGVFWSTFLRLMLSWTSGNFGKITLNIISNFLLYFIHVFLSK